MTRQLAYIYKKRLVPAFECCKEKLIDLNAAKRSSAIWMLQRKAHHGWYDISHHFGNHLRWCLFSYVDHVHTTCYSPSHPLLPAMTCFWFFQTDLWMAVFIGLGYCRIAQFWAKMPLNTIDTTSTVLCQHGITPRLCGVCAIIAARPESHHGGAWLQRYYRARSFRRCLWISEAETQSFFFCCNRKKTLEILDESALDVCRNAAMLHNRNHWQMKVEFPGLRHPDRRWLVGAHSASVLVKSLSRPMVNSLGQLQSGISSWWPEIPARHCR